MQQVDLATINDKANKPVLSRDKESSSSSSDFWRLKPTNSTLARSLTNSMRFRLSDRSVLSQSQKSRIGVVDDSETSAISAVLLMQTSLLANISRPLGAPRCWIGRSLAGLCRTLTLSRQKSTTEHVPSLQRSDVRKSSKRVSSSSNPGGVGKYAPMFHWIRLRADSCEAPGKGEAAGEEQPLAPRVVREAMSLKTSTAPET